MHRKPRKGRVDSADELISLVDRLSRRKGHDRFGIKEFCRETRVPDRRREWGSHRAGTNPRNQTG